MPTPEVVVFDLGKVLVDFDYRIAASRIAARSRLSPEEVQALIDHSPLLVRFETGRLTREQLFAEVQSGTGFSGTLEEFGRFFSDIFTPIEPMVRLHAELREAGVPSFIFSNTNELAVGHIRNQFPFFSTFDGYILSYEHGSMKPEPVLYEVVEEQTGRRGAALFYLDDRPENIQTGLQRGWQAVLHASPEQTKTALRQAGLLR
jgi:FMN phosphatase YigB (HAD superfamily)